MADPHFASVVLLAVNDNAADGTTTFVDQSTSAKTITRNGGAVYDDAQAPTGMTTSCLLDGSGDSLSLASSADFGYGTGDFTIEWFPKYNVATGTKVHLEQRANDNDVRPLVYSDGTNINYFVSGAARISGAQPANFQHMAICRSGTTTKMFKAGTQLGSDYSDSNDYPSSILKIGASKDAGADFNGWIGNVRITKGVARYTSDFTPPALPFPITAADVPVAAFSGTPLSGTAPLTVQFTDASTNTPTSWLWDFGDSTTSTSQSPSHQYAAAGTYTVTLTATNAAGSSAPEVKTGYITVTAAPVATTTRTSGVKKKPPVIRLADVRNREDTASFLKSQLKKHQTEIPEAPKIDDKERRKVAKQARREAEMRRKAADAAARFAIEKSETEASNDEQISIQNNNAILLLMLGAA